MIGVISLSNRTNYDGVMFDESDEADLGVGIRNSKGQVMATLSEKNQETTFSCDFGAIGNKKSSSGMEKSVVGHIIKDTLSYVSLLQSYSFSHVNRQGNAVAHAFAQRARLSFPLQVWMESIPPDLDAVISVDLKSLD